MFGCQVKCYQGSLSLDLHSHSIVLFSQNLCPKIPKLLIDRNLGIDVIEKITTMKASVPVPTEDRKDRLIYLLLRDPTRSTESSTFCKSTEVQSPKRCFALEAERRIEYIIECEFGRKSASFDPAVLTRNY